jgi:hypothetical protein
MNRNFTPLFYGVLVTSLFSCGSEYSASDIIDALEGTIEVSDESSTETDLDESESLYASDSVSVTVSGSSSYSDIVMMQKYEQSYSIDGNNGTTQEGSQVYIWSTDEENENQYWVEINYGDSYYSYQKYDTSLCLDGGDDGANGQAVTLETCDSSDYNQHWLKVFSDEDTYRLVKRNATDYAIDGGNGGEDGQGIYLWDSESDNENQMWQFTILEEATDTPPSRAAWSLTSSNNSADLHFAIDPWTDTRWTTDAVQTDGQWLTIDLSRNSVFNTIKLDSDDSPDDYPRYYEVYVSDDGETWGSAIAAGYGSSSTTEITFDEVEARYIKIEQNGSSDDYWWSVHDIEVTGIEQSIAYSDCTEISSVSELVSYLDASDVCVVMEPGTYSLTTDMATDDGLLPDEELLLFTGSNNRFIFDGVTLEIDTDLFRSYGVVDVNEFHVTGSNNTFMNLTIEDTGDTAPYKTAQGIVMDGEDNLIIGFYLSTNGSYPYGYGDIFGKGSTRVLNHKKHNGILVRGDRNHLKNCTLVSHTYGHGIFVQGAEDAVIEGCYVEGELRTTDEVLAEEGTGTDADDVDFLTVWGYYLTELENNYNFSLQEDGIRAYATGNIYGTDESRDTTNITVIDSTVKYMRSGVTIGWADGDKYVENCTSLATENGYWVGSGAEVINSRGDSSVGPLFGEDAERSGSTLELTLLDNIVTKIGNTPSMYFAGSDHSFTIHDGTTYVNDDTEFLMSGERYGHRWLTGSDTEPNNFDADSLTVDNETAYPIIVGENATDNDITTCGSITDNGSGTYVEAGTNCQ